MAKQSLFTKDGVSYAAPFAAISALFFFWGFVHNLDPILIPHLKKSFRLTTLQASLIDSAVFIAYFVMAIPAGMIMKKYGYKTGIITGLALFALGCFLFVPSANLMSYVFFLGSLFIVACGLTILETAANPYATVLGNPATAPQRLNFAQSFNGLAAFLAPIVGGHFILSADPLSTETLAAMPITEQNAYLLSEASSVKMPYIILGCAILLMAVIFFIIKLPDITDKEETAHPGFFHAFKHKHLTWSVIAQFFYVGAQVCVLSFLILYATKVANISEQKASWYAGAAGLAFMSGRFVGTFLMRYVKPATLLFIYAIICIALSLIAVFGTGFIALYAVIGIAFFMSIMFPTIFAFGIQGLGADTKSGSSLIIMAIVGGALLPPVLGFIADKAHNIQTGYIVPLVCFLIIAIYSKIGVRKIYDR
jgi:FHS family L-fucose permease-like MFS transporter